MLSHEPTQGMITAKEAGQGLMTKQVDRSTVKDGIRIDEEKLTSMIREGSTGGERITRGDLSTIKKRLIAEMKRS